MSAELLRRAADKMRRDQRSKGRLSMTLRSVADWLDAESTITVGDGGSYRHACAVARAYLGEQP